MTIISIIAPVHNEEDVIVEFIQRVLAVCETLRDRYEFDFILVDDGSRDRSLELMKNASKTEKHLRIIGLRRNYGQTAALQAGLDHARGDIIITMDADLQHFPEEIPDFLRKLEEGYDLVCGWRKDRAEDVVRTVPSWIANRMIQQIAKTNVHDYGTTFRLYRAEFVHELRMYGEFHRFMPALIASLGGRVTEIPIKNIPRPKGKSHYGFERTFGVLLDILLLKFLLQYMDRPLRAFGKVAAITFSIGMIILLGLVIYAYMYNVQAVQQHIGWFMIAIILILTSMQIILTGIIAEVLIRVFYGIRDQRVYAVRAIWGGK